MELSETAAILDAILNFSKRSTLQGVHPADSERVHPRLPKSINKNTLHKISGFSSKSGFGCRTNVEDLELLTGIAPPDIRRVVCAQVEKTKQETNEAHSLYGKNPAEEKARVEELFLA